MGGRCARCVLVLVLVLVIAALGAAAAGAGADTAARVLQLRGRLTDEQARARALGFEHMQLSRQIDDKRRQHADVVARLDAKKTLTQQAVQSLEEVRKSMTAGVDEEVQGMERTQGQLESQLAALRTNLEGLLRDKAALLQKISDSGIDHYVDAYTQDFSPVVKGVVYKSKEVITPFFSFISHAADTNNRLVDHVSSEIDTYVHFNVKKSPFVSGLLFYLVLLVPVLAVSMLAAKLSAFSFTVSHCVLFNSLYLFCLSAGCGLVSLFASQEPMALFRLRHGSVFVAFLLVLSLVYAVHLVLLGLQAAVSQSRRDVAQLLGTAAIGVHFFWFAWRPAMLDQKITMYSYAFYVYATILGFVIYERAERLNLTWLPRKQAAIAASDFASIARERLLDAVNQILTYVGVRRLRRGSRRSSRRRDALLGRDR